LLLAGGRWQPLFIIPPLLMLGIGLVWYRFSPPGQQHAERVSPFADRAALAAAVRQFWPFLVTAVIAGGLFNGALFYAPTFVAQTLPVDQAALTAVVFPIFGLFGTMGLNSLILRWTQGHVLRGLIMLLLLAAAARGLAFLLPPFTLSAVVLLGALGVTAYALTNMLLSAVPLLYAHLGTSQVAGLMDATHSVGGALGSTLVGVLLAQGGWSLVFAAWLLLPLLGVAFVSLGLRVLAAPRAQHSGQ
jgi:predicted MFS family arabinose efflux permease